MSGVFYHSAIHGLGFFICFIRLELIPVSVDASPLQDYPPALNSPVPFHTPGWREALRECSVLPKQYIINT